MRSLVIGADSLSGRYMCNYLFQQQEEFVGTKLVSEQCELFPGHPLENMDLLNIGSIITVLERYKPDYIFNFAAQSSVDFAWKNPGMTVEVNVNGVLNLFEAIRTAKINPTVILIGAGEEYGRVDFQRLPALETETLSPGNIYAATKACQSMMAQIYHKAYGLKLIVARTFNIIGPGQSETYAVSNFCYQAVLIEKWRTEPIIRIGNPNIQRDFTDIRDVVRAYWMLAEKGIPGEVYNVGRGKAVSIQKVLGYVQRQLNVCSYIYVDRQRMRPIDTPKIEGNICKIQSDVGWRAEIPLEQTIRDIMAYWREILN